MKLSWRPWRAEKRKWQPSQTGKLILYSLSVSSCWFPLPRRFISCTRCWIKGRYKSTTACLSCCKAGTGSALAGSSVPVEIEVFFISKQIKSTQKTSCNVRVYEIQLVISQQICTIWIPTKCLQFDMVWFHIWGKSPLFFLLYFFNNKTKKQNKMPFASNQHQQHLSSVLVCLAVVEAAASCTEMVKPSPVDKPGQKPVTFVPVSKSGRLIATNRPQASKRAS